MVTTRSDFPDGVGVAVGVGLRNQLFDEGIAEDGPGGLEACCLL